MMLSISSNKAKENKLLIISLFFSIINIIVFPSSSHPESFSNYQIIRKIDSDKITFSSYKEQESQKIDVSDLIIWDEIYSNQAIREKVFNTFQSERLNLRLFLLQEGYAKLKRPESSQSQELKAQNDAKSKELSIWAKPVSVATQSPASVVTTPLPPPSSIQSFLIVVAAIVIFVAGTAMLCYFIWLVIKSKEQEAKSKQQIAEKKQREAEIKQREVEEKLIRMKAHAKKIDKIEYVYQDVILLGTRSCGKTSIAKQWVAPWTNIHDNEATEVLNKENEVDLFTLSIEKKLDPEFEVEITVKKILRLRIHDYPGDDEYREQAIKNLSDLNNAVILFVFNLEEEIEDTISRRNSNKSYYSNMFVQSINDCKELTKSVIKAFVVFNKIDCLPNDWSDQDIMEKLKDANVDAIDNIERGFSPRLDYYAISAENSKGLLHLIGDVHKVAMENQKIDPKEMEELMNKFSRENK